MSGGFYDYIYYKDISNIDLSELARIEEDMRAEGYRDVANEVFRYKLELETAKNRLDIMRQRLEGVLRGWEWYKSGDTNKKQFEEIMNKFFSTPS